MFVKWLKKKNRQRLEKRQARRHAKSPSPAPFSSLCSGIDFDEIVTPESLHLQTSDRPVVSIIVPGYGKADYTLRCLKSIQETAIQTPFEVIVVEDASGDPSAEALRKVDGIQLIWNPSNLGFLLSCNMAAKHARGEFILLLNNDTVLLRDAVDALIETAQARPDAGIVGSKLIYPDGSLQEAGGIVWDNGDAANYGRHQNPLDPRFCYPREADYVSGASILLRRSLWNQMGGFDERYVPAYYEDTDLSIRLQKAGYPTLFEPRSIVVHCEGVSNGTSTDHGIKAYQVVNREKFIEAHGDYLRQTRARSGDLSYRCVDRLKHHAGLVLIIDHYLPEPDVDAGSRNMLEFIRTLHALNYVVKFWPQNLLKTPKYTEMLERMGVETFRSPYQKHFEDWVSTHGKDISHVLLSRPSVAPFYFDAVRCHTNAQVIYYGHDLHFARMMMEAKVKHDADIELAAREMQETEKNIWQRSDLVLYPSQEEIDVVRQVCPTCNAEFVPPFQFDRFVVRTCPTQGHKLLFVAGFQHTPNVDAACWLVRDVMPIVWEKIPSVQVYLVGSKPTAEVQALAKPSKVVVTGSVTVEDLERHYRESRVSVVPLRFGAGVKLKVLETMQQGVPLVTTAVGLQGLPGVTTSTSTAYDDCNLMAERICLLMRDDAIWMDVSRRQTTYARTHFSIEGMRARFEQLLGTL